MTNIENTPNSHTPPSGEGWVLIDVSLRRYYRQLGEYTFEFREEWNRRGRLEYKQHTIELDLDTNYDRVLSNYGFDSIEHLKRECPNEWAYLLSEMIFECLPKFD